MVTSWLLGSLFVGANLAYGAYYSGQIYPGIKVGGLDIGGMTRNQASVALRSHLSDYRIDLRIDDKGYKVHPNELGAKYELEPTLDAAMAAGRDDLLPLVSLLTNRTVPTLSFAYSLDKTRLQTYVERVMTEQAQAPVDATVVINDGKPVVQPDKPGLGVEKDSLVSLLQQGVGAQVSTVQVRRHPVQADVVAAVADESAKAAAQVLATPVTLKYGDKTFTPASTEIAGWLKFEKSPEGKLVVGMDTDKVKAYVGGIAAGINIAAVDKKVSVVNGEVKTEEGGQDGLAVDQDSLVAQLTNTLLAKTGAEITITASKVAYKTVYNRSYTLAAGKYVEINLTLQRMWAYQDHQLVYESPVTSGATGHGFATVEGLFAIQAKQTNRYLDGRLSPFPYYVHVDYWMPFYGDYGLHDATWRSVFGTSDYYWNGSHGCVNLPWATASWLYSFVSVGTPVWVHR